LGSGGPKLKLHQMRLAPTGPWGVSNCVKALHSIHQAGGEGTSPRRLLKRADRGDRGRRSHRKGRSDEDSLEGEIIERTSGPAETSDAPLCTGLGIFRAVRRGPVLPEGQGRSGFSPSSSAGRRFSTPEFDGDTKDRAVHVHACQFEEARLSKSAAC